MTDLRARTRNRPLFRRVARNEANLQVEGTRPDAEAATCLTDPLCSNQRRSCKGTVNSCAVILHTHTPCPASMTTRTVVGRTLCVCSNVFRSPMAHEHSMHARQDSCASNARRAHSRYARTGDGQWTTWPTNRADHPRAQTDLHPSDPLTRARWEPLGGVAAAECAREPPRAQSKPSANSRSFS